MSAHTIDRSRDGRQAVCACGRWSYHAADPATVLMAAELHRAVSGGGVIPMFRLLPIERFLGEAQAADDTGEARRSA